MGGPPIPFHTKPNIFLDKFHVIFGALYFPLPATGGTVENISTPSVPAAPAAVGALSVHKYQATHGRPPFSGRRSRNRLVVLVAILYPRLSKTVQGLYNPLFLCSAGTPGTLPQAQRRWWAGYQTSAA